MTKLSEHFAAEEFFCKCGQCAPQIEPPRALIDGLEALRALLDDRPIIITSGYRCAAHNAAVGGVAQSNHLTARAADIAIDGINPMVIAALVESKIPTLRALPYQTYTHIDLRD